MHPANPSSFRQESTNLLFFVLFWWGRQTSLCTKTCRCGENVGNFKKRKIAKSLIFRGLAICFELNSYPEPGSNRHALRHWCLRPTRLPIPPSGLIVTLLARAKVNIICDLQFTICNFFSFHTHFCSFSYRLGAEKNRERWQMRPDVWANAAGCVGRCDRMYGPMRPDVWANATGCMGGFNRMYGPMRPNV